MLRIILLLLSILSLAVGNCSAQLPPLSRAYLLNNYTINPAISGIESYADGLLSFRQQWVGLEGAPRTLRASLHAPIGSRNFSSAESVPASLLNESSGRRLSYSNKYQPRKPHHGIGGQLMLDQIGPFDRQALSLSYAYHVPLSNTLQLSAGVQAGWYQYHLATQRITLGTPMDAAIASGGNRYGYPTVGLGLWAYSGKAYLGFSLYQNLNTASSPGSETAAPFRWGYMAVGYKHALSPIWTLQPNVLLRLASHTLSYDVGMRALWQERIWIGAAYRSSQEGVAMFGMHLSPLLSISYAYETGGSSRQTHNGGSHEIVLHVRLFNRQQVLCPQQMW
jgi:type IX secretion system PorP/SprF family membrane protein